MDGMCCSWKQDCPHTYRWGSANLQKVHTTILWSNLLLQQSDEMMSGAAFPVHLIQMKLILCVFLGRKSACKEKDRSLTEKTTFKSSMTTTRSTGRGLISPILRMRRRGSGSKRVLLVACQNCIIVIFCHLCLPLLLSVCFWFLLLFVSSASDYSLLPLLLAWHFFLNP